MWDEACVVIGSRFSVRGDPRFDAGEAALNGFEKAEGGVERGILPFGDLWKLIALSGVLPAEVIDAGVTSCGLLLLEFRTSGAGEALRSMAGDLGGTCGGSSRSSSKLAVSTFNAGFGIALGLSIGDNGFPGTLCNSEESGMVLY
jgi:hypothetical protein